jgi:hypothetical protein
VRDYAPTAYPDNYAGIASGTPASVDRLVIYLVGETPQIQADLVAVSGIHDPDKVVFEQGRLSTSDSAVLHARVEATVPRLMSEGFLIQDYGVGVDGAEEFGIHDLTDAQTARLVDLFGPDVRVHEAPENSFGEHLTPSLG